MPPIAIHHTSVTKIDQPWDGSKNKAALKLGADEAYYRKAFAWQDPDKDSTLKGSWRFIHHEVDTNGTIGAANVRGCQFGISVLNGAMSGTDIPDADRQGVYDHLAAHLKDAKVEPTELKSGQAGPEIEQRGGIEVERRILDLKVIALRTVNNRQPEIDGMAAVYNRETVIGGLFKEVIKPGAFSRVLSENPDVVGVPNHDWGTVLGRTLSGTLRLTDQKDYGLHYKIIINQHDQEAMNFYSRVERGDIQHSSFAFTVRKDIWTNPANPKDLPLRSITEVDKLFDVSPVTFPAYPTTTASTTTAAVRSKVSSLRPTVTAGQARSDGREDWRIKAAARRCRLQMWEHKP
jgi:HK97 family phage prohead protease